MSSVQPEIEVARPDDAAAIVDIIRLGFRPNLLDKFIYGCAGVENYVRELIRTHPIADTTFLVARAEGEVAGCIEMRSLADRLFLNYVAVRPEIRAAKIGSRLLAAAITRCRREEQHAMSLDVLEDNAVASAWYAKLGFARDHETVWWTLPLQSDGIEYEAQVAGIPQQVTNHAAFGFSSLDVPIAGAAHRVGLLGDRWFRLTTPESVSEGRLHSVLRRIDATREVLALLPLNEMPEALSGLATRVTATHRMTADLDSLIHHLEVNS